MLTYIPVDSLTLAVTQGAALPARTLTWLDGVSGEPIQFVSDPHSFELRVTVGDEVVAKVAGIVGGNVAPNVQISFSQDEALVMLTPDHYPAQLWGMSDVSGLPREPVNIRFVVRPRVDSA